LFVLAQQPTQWIDAAIFCGFPALFLVNRQQKARHPFSHRAKRGVFNSLPLCFLLFFRSCCHKTTKKKKDEKGDNHRTNARHKAKTEKDERFTTSDYDARCVQTRHEERRPFFLLEKKKGEKDHTHAHTFLQLGSIKLFFKSCTLCNDTDFFQTALVSKTQCCDKGRVSSPAFAFQHKQGTKTQRRMLRLNQID